MSWWAILTERLYSSLDFREICCFNRLVTERKGPAPERELPEAERLTEPRDLGTVCGNRIRRRLCLCHAFPFPNFK